MPQSRPSSLGYESAATGGYRTFLCRHADVVFAPILPAQGQAAALPVQPSQKSLRTQSTMILTLRRRWDELAQDISAPSGRCPNKTSSTSSRDANARNLVRGTSRWFCRGGRSPSLLRFMRNRFEDPAIGGNASPGKPPNQKNDFSFNPSPRPIQTTHPLGISERALETETSPGLWDVLILN
jgi:hypothetical protein